MASTFSETYKKLKKSISKKNWCQIMFLNAKDALFNYRFHSRFKFHPLVVNLSKILIFTNEKVRGIFKKNSKKLKNRDFVTISFKI